MKAIEININGTVRYSAIKSVKDGICLLSDRATNYIKAQSADGKIYYGNWKQIENPYAYEDGTITRFFIKPEQLNPIYNMFGIEQEETVWITCKIINIMED